MNYGERSKLQVLPELGHWPDIFCIQEVWLLAEEGSFSRCDGKMWSQASIVCPQGALIILGTLGAAHFFLVLQFPNDSGLSKMLEEHFLEAFYFIVFVKQNSFFEFT